MDWHTTWQDPVAIALVVVCVAFAMWLRRRVARDSGCGSCHAHGPSEPAAEGPSRPSGFVALGELRMSRRASDRKDRGT